MAQVFRCFSSSSPCALRFPAMAEQKQVQQLQAQIDALQAQLSQMQPVPATVVGAGQPQLVGQPVRVQHEITAGASALTKPDRGEWTCYSIGWVFCCLFFPVGCLIWSTIACNFYCQPREVRRNHPSDGQVAKTALVTILTWISIFCFLLLVSIIYQASKASSIGTSSISSSKYDTYYR